jgi:hypothetical protein
VLPALLADVLGGYAEVPGVQAKWAAWRRRQELDDRLPEPFSEVLAHVFAFADRALAGIVAGSEWRPDKFAWRAGDERA